MERLISAVLLALLAYTVSAQDVETQRAIRLGTDAYRKGDHTEATRQFERAATDRTGAYNLGNALYRSDSMAAAAGAFSRAAALAQGPAEQARAYHNLGNAYMAQKRYSDAVSAYKEGLKRAPNSEDTRYNLAYAQQMAYKEKEEQGDKQQKDEPKEDGDKKEQQPDPNGDRKDEQGQQQKPGKPQEAIDQRDAERMLDAMQQKEKETQEKMRAKLRVRPRTPIDKDW